MKKFSKLALILWAISALFFLVSFSFIASGKIGEFFTGVVIAAVLAFVGWKKSKPKETVKPAPQNIVKQQPQIFAQKPSIPPMPKITITSSTASCIDEEDDDENEVINDTISVTAQKLSTIKALKTFTNYVVIDFETTGFSAKSDKAIEVACLKVLNGESYKYQTLIDPQVHISSRITKINGLTDADVSGCPTIASVARQVYDFCENLPFVAHNASFDMGFLKQAYKEADIEADLIYVDTLKLSRSAFPEYDTHKLEFLVKELDLAEKQTHRAMDDVLCTKKLLDICIAKIIEQKEAAKQSRKQASTISE